MVRYALLVLVGCCGAAVVRAEAWTETFDDGLGRFTFTSGAGDTAFVHDPVAGALHGTFVRRDPSMFTADRRLALLGDTFDQTDAVGFRVQWTPEQGSPTAFPYIGFFDSATLDDVAVLAITDNGYQIEIGRNQPDAFHIEDAGFAYVLGETYLIEFLLDGQGTVSLSSSIWQGGGFVSQGMQQWSVGTQYAFDALGVGNLLDDHGFDQTFVADFDNFTFISEPATWLLLAGVFMLCRRRPES